MTVNLHGIDILAGILELMKLAIGTRKDIIRHHVVSDLEFMDMYLNIPRYDTHVKTVLIS